MLYKSSVLTATFFLLSIGYANGQSVASELPTVKDSSSDSVAQSRSEKITETAMERSISIEPLDPRNAKTRSIEPLDLVVSETLIPAATNRAGNSSIDVVVNPDLPVANLAMGYVIPLSDALPVNHRSIAQSPAETAPTEPKKWAVGVHAQASTTGFFGVDGGYKFSPNLHARLGLNTGGFSYPYSSQGIDYNASFKPTNIHLLGDYFPFSGGLRLTGGFVIQNNRFTGSAKSNSNDQININGTNYNSSQIGTIESEGKFGNSVAPYLGIGFGTPISSGFGFNIDAGVMFAGSPTVSLVANNINPSVPAAAQAQLRSDLAAQERQTNADIKNFNLYPAISIGFSYAF
jgi:hypothetical protein